MLLSVLTLEISATYASGVWDDKDIDGRVDVVRKQLETQDYLNKCLGKPYSTLNEGIQQLDKGNNLAIWTTWEIEEFKKTNAAANKAKHQW